MHVVGLGTAAPPSRYAQHECWDALQTSTAFVALASRSRAILRRVLCSDNGIATRHLALNPLTEAFDLTPDALHERFSRHAPVLATQAAERALANAGISAAQIDAVLISTLRMR